MDSLPHFSLGTAVVVVFLACAGYVMLRGIGKVLVGTTQLAFSAWVGFLTWQQAPSLSIDWFGKSVPAVTTGLPIAAAVIVFILIRIALRWVVSPFGEPAPKQKSSGGLSMWKVTVLLGIALIPTFILLIIGVGIIHHTGSVSELRAYASQPAAEPSEDGPSLLQQLKQSIEQTVPREWLEKIDPLANRSRMAVAKLVARQSAESSGDHAPVIDPQTGEPIPRAILVEDAEIQKLAREQKFGTLLRHPVITRALEDPEVQKLIKDLKS